MKIEYRKATIDDIETLTKTRIEVIRATNKFQAMVDMSAVEKQSYDYYQQTLENENHVAYLVYDGDRFVGSGGVSFYRVMPSYHNPSGYQACIMNMYTSPAYRRKGIATKMLDLLVAAAKEKGITHITLESTVVGRPLYEKYGFRRLNDEMQLLER